MNNLDAEYITLCQVESDINQHLPTLKRYASYCETVAEMGCRKGISTTALLAGRPKKMYTIDIFTPEYYGASLPHLEELAKEAGTEFEFVLNSSLDIEIDGSVDLLFLDTIHTYTQVSAELTLHGNKTEKFILIHDIFSCPQIVPAITEFMNKNKNWIILQWDDFNNGLGVLYNKDNDEPTTS
jgi:predicted O-methyltransferase YrrM